MAVTMRARPLIGPLADSLLLGCGATLLAFAGSQLLQRWAPGALAWPWAVALSLILVSPHYAATYRRAYASRERVRQHAGATLAAPLLLVAAAVAAFRNARVAALYALLYAVWSGYHYSRQSLGISLLFPLRRQQPLAPGEKRWLALTLYASWAVSFVGFAQAGEPGRNDTIAYVRAAFPGLRLGPRWLAAALLLTWHHGRGAAGPWVLAYVAFVVLVGAALNLALPFFVARAGSDAVLAAAVVPAAINLHHYVLDGRIWRLRDQRVVASFA